MGVKKIDYLTCQQLYNLWISEPELVKIIDLRSKVSFDESHIPGALFGSLQNLSEILDSIGNRLAILICNNSEEQAVIEKTQGSSNFVFLKDCKQWFEDKYPLTYQHKINNLNYSKGLNMTKEVIVHQIFEHQSSTYTYIIADSKSREAAIIDPVLETVERDIKWIEEMGLKLIYALDTHIHADHITGAGEFRKRLNIKTGVSHVAGVSCVDIPLEDGQELLLGDKKIRVIATPGHTNTCVSYYFEGMVFTGDALLIRGCGRTDFQEGSSENLFKSVREKLFSLPEDTIVYPGHDYRGFTSSTIKSEKLFNPRLKESIGLDDFKKIMSELKLANPKKIHEAVPANLTCGQVKSSREFNPQIVDGIPEVNPKELYAHISSGLLNKKVKLIDVRRPDEFNAELGHIDGAQLVTLGPDLTKYLETGDRSEEIVFICRSGGRSGNATAESIKMGYKFTVNMAGGMIRWNEEKLPTLKK